MTYKYLISFSTNLRRMEVIISAEDKEEVEEIFCDKYLDEMSFSEEEYDDSGKLKYKIRIKNLEQ